MNVDDVLAAARDSVTTRRVYAEPVERGGITVIAAAAVAGGGGGGGGGSGTEEGRQGSGGGFGLRAKPVGAYIIKDGQVTWRPAIDVNRLIVVAGAVAITALMVGARLLHRPS